uniref:Uncharacterized protein n=1 Tax=Tanacetum cinerariifolium TaxID=118510 RepID=A0A6L2P222_TANCI|nr:hypothetical protein [Tanacetum cinerariifolium]
MTTTAAQQVALDNALVPLEKRVKIGKCKLRIDPAKTQKEPTYEVVLDALDLTTCYPITADVSEIYMHQFSFTINKKDSTSYKFKIEKKSYRIDIESLIICTNHGEVCGLYQTSLGRLHVQIENRDHKKQEKMHYPRFTKAVIHHFITKDKSISMRNKMFIHTSRDDSILGTMRFVSKYEDFQIYRAVLPKRMTNQQMRDSNAYKTYLAYATGAASPKMKRKLKKTCISFEAKNSCHHTYGVSVSKKKAPAKVARSKGIKLPSNVALLVEARLKRTLKRSKRETTIHQAGGSSEGADFESEGDSGDEANEQSDDEDEQSDDDHEQVDDSRTESDDEEEETQDDEINEELYGDVNVSLTDAEPADKEKDDEEMTVAGHVNVNQEGAGNQVKDDAHTTQKTKDINVQHEVPHTSPLLTIPVSVIPEHTVANPPKIVTTTSSTPISSLLVTDLEKDVKELKTVDHSLTLLSSIKSKVPKAVKGYLRTTLDDVLHKVLQKHSLDITKEHPVPADIVERLRQQYVPEKRTEDIKKIKLEHARQQQVPKEMITSSDTFTLEEFDDADKDEGPSAGSDRGLKRRKTSKETEPSKKAKSTETSKGMSKSQPKFTDKSAQVKATVFEVEDTQEPHNQGQNMGNTDDQPNVKADPKHNWFKEPERPLILDSDWNVRKSVDFRLPHT